MYLTCDCKGSAAPEVCIQPRIPIEEWEIMGDEILSLIPAERSRLMKVFPGVNSFMGRPYGVFGAECHFCKATLNPNNWSIDFYDGQIYCVFCCPPTLQSVIPRDIIESWDFTEKTVSQESHSYIQSVLRHPNIDISKRAVGLYDVVPGLARVRRLRCQISMLCFELANCDESSAKQLSQGLLDREYMLASIREVHLYSTQDLIDVANGSLEKQLQQAVNQFGLPHFRNCFHCKLRRKTCELCLDSTWPIFLHQVDLYRMCPAVQCSRVMHVECVKRFQRRLDRKNSPRGFQRVRVQMKSSSTCVQADNQWEQVNPLSGPVLCRFCQNLNLEARRYRVNSISARQASQSMSPVDGSSGLESSLDMSSD